MLIDKIIFVIGGLIKRFFVCGNVCYFFDGKVFVECYDDENDKWNDRIVMFIGKIFFRENFKVID